MKTHSEPRSGRRGDIVAKSNHFGPYETKHTPPRKAPTAAQEESWAEFGWLAKAWQDLTEEQRQAWNARCSQAKSKSRLGKRWSLTGQTFFNRVNNNRSGFKRGLVKEPPPIGQTGPNPVGKLLITNRGSRIALELEVTGPLTTDIMVYASRPCSRGRSKWFKFVRLCPLPAPKGGRSDITSRYAHRFGVPPEGTRVFIRTRQLNGGPRDIFKETNAVVPSRQTPIGPPGGKKVLRWSNGGPTEIPRTNTPRSCPFHARPTPVLP